MKRICSYKADSTHTLAALPKAIEPSFSATFAGKRVAVTPQTEHNSRRTQR